MGFKKGIQLATLALPCQSWLPRSAPVAAATKRLFSSSLPTDYEVPAVWRFEGNAMATAGSNRPTAGARSESVLPVGEHPLQLYSLGTPNGLKISILLEELNDALGVEYDAWKIDIGRGDQFGSGFVEVNPNSKIPALVDRDVGVRVFESGSILLHLADKYEAFVPADPGGRAECLNWLFFQVGGAPSLGAFKHFYDFAPVKIEYAIDRFALEAKRQLSVLEDHLGDERAFMCGDEYTIADIALFPWVSSIDAGAHDFLQLADYDRIAAWMARVAERPAVQRGLRVLGRGDGALAERHSRADFGEQLSAA